MKIHGGCHCGSIRYEAEVDPTAVGVCHCTDCQTFSGAAFRVVVPAKKENFRLLSGAPRTYVKTAESGNKRAQVFCAECGTHIYATNAADPQVFGIRAGTAQQRRELTPTRQVWCRSALPWVKALDEIPQLQTQA